MGGLTETEALQDNLCESFTTLVTLRLNHSVSVKLCQSYITEFELCLNLLAPQQIVLRCILSVAFAGDGNAGLHQILSGCKNLRKLEIRDLLENASKLETMRSLWMSSCFVTSGACRQLAEKMPRLNVEVIEEKSQRPLESQPEIICPVEKLHVYRTIAGQRSDTPQCVCIV